MELNLVFYELQHFYSTWQTSQVSYEPGTKPLLSINLYNLIAVFSKDIPMCSAYHYGLQNQLSVQSIITQMKNQFKSLIFRDSVTFRIYSSSLKLWSLLLWFLVQFKFLHKQEQKPVSNIMITHLSDRLSDSASLKALAVSESASFTFKCELLSCQRRGFSSDINGVFSSLSVIMVTCNWKYHKPLFSSVI